MVVDSTVVTVKDVVGFLGEYEDALHFLTDELSDEALLSNYGSLVSYNVTEVTTDEFEVYVTFAEKVTGVRTFLAFIMSAFVACEFVMKFEGFEFFDVVSAGFEGNSDL